MEDINRATNKSYKRINNILLIGVCPISISLQISMQTIAKTFKIVKIDGASEALSFVFWTSNKPQKNYLGCVLFTNLRLIKIIE